MRIFVLLVTFMVSMTFLSFLLHEPVHEYVSILFWCIISLSNGFLIYFEINKTTDKNNKPEPNLFSAQGKTDK